jgi:transglutaminase-like putative cysteine protease
VKRGPAAAAALLLLAIPGAAFCGSTAVYFARGRDVALFDQLDVDGYSLEAVPQAAGVRLVVRAGAPRVPSRALRAVEAVGAPPAPAPDRDRLALSLVSGRRFQSEAAAAVLDWVHRSVAYDPDRSLPQDPAAVFASRRAYCVGFAELSVDLLRRAGIPAATVQGVLVSGPDAPGYDRELSGVYHRWVEIFYPDRGWTFADPLASGAGVDARYVAFARRSWTRPGDLSLTVLSAERGAAAGGTR